MTSIASDLQKHDTYNFEVQDYHTYFVGKSALWVHNMRATTGPKGPLPEAAESIDPVKIREIERRVRAGETSFPLDTGAQLRAVAESFATKIRTRLARGKADQARNVQRAGNEAIDRLDRFDALTPAARQQLRNIVNGAFQ